MDQSDNPQNRRSTRSNVLLAATIEVAGAAMAVKLRNLSSEGALIEAKGLPAEGSEVLFRRNEIGVVSRIAWVQGNQAGVAFQSPLPREQVLRNVPQPKHRTPTQFRRPGLASREMTAEERRLAESWVWSPSRVLGS